MQQQPQQPQPQLQLQLPRQKQQRRKKGRNRKQQQEEGNEEEVKQQELIEQPNAKPKPAVLLKQTQPQRAGKAIVDVAVTCHTDTFGDFVRSALDIIFGYHSLVHLLLICYLGLKTH